MKLLWVMLMTKQDLHNSVFSRRASVQDYDNSNANHSDNYRTTTMTITESMMTMATAMTMTTIDNYDNNWY